MGEWVSGESWIKGTSALSWRRKRAGACPRGRPAGEGKAGPSGDKAKGHLCLRSKQMTWFHLRGKCYCSGINTTTGIWDWSLYIESRVFSLTVSPCRGPGTALSAGLILRGSRIEQSKNHCLLPSLHWFPAQTLLLETVRHLWPQDLRRTATGRSRSSPRALDSVLTWLNHFRKHLKNLELSQFASPISVSFPTLACCK